MKALLSLLFGFIFGLGLIISQMTNPAKVLSFLTIGENWDPSLLIVMAVAMGIMMLAWRWTNQKGSSLFGGKVSVSDLKHVDAKLVTGAALFGLGWGISGICPGPGLVQLVSFKSDFLLFFASLLLGMFIAKKVNR